jgi:effector-binding domain-containing protein
VAYSVEPRAVVPAPLASVRKRVARSQISASIIPMFDIVYAFLRANGIEHHGINVCVYRDEQQESIELETGVLVKAPFSDGEEVRCSATPAGNTLWTVHFGEYSALGAAYDALFNAVKQRGVVHAGIFWEVYGHWEDDPALRRTDIYLLLA